MSDARVLIVDSDEDYRTLMCEFIRETDGLTVAGEAASTQEAIEFLEAVDADILLMDLLLPGNDGVFLLKKLQNLANRPGVVVNSSFMSPMAAQQCTKLQVSALMLKPSQPEAVIERLLSVREFGCCQKRPYSGAGTSNESADLRLLTSLMQQLGFSAHYKGYHYLREAVMLSLGHGQLDRGYAKIVYADVAQLHCVSSASVDRAIRTAIEGQCKNGGIHLWREKLGISLLDTPTNTAAIAALAEHLRSRHSGVRKTV